MLAALWIAGGAAARAQSANTLGRQGNQFFKEDRFDEAIDDYRRALELDPSSPVLQYNLGTALASKGKTEDAEKALKQAAEAPAAPVTRDSWFNLGVALGDPAVKAPAPNAQAAAPAAQTQQNIDQLKKALDAFRHAILTDSQDDAAKYNYELTQERLKQLEQQQQQQQQQQNQDQKKQDKDQQKQDQNQQQNQDQQKQDQQKQDQQNQQQDKQEQEQQQQQDQKNGEQQDKQNPQNGQEKPPQGTPTPTPTPQAANPSQEQQAQAGEQADQDKQMTPEQMDAMRLLNLLEKENPEQFKRLFQFHGQQRKLDKEW